MAVHGSLTKIDSDAGICRGSAQIHDESRCIDQPRNLKHVSKISAGDWGYHFGHGRYRSEGVSKSTFRDPITQRYDLVIVVVRRKSES